MLYLLERELKPVEESRRQELFDDGFLEREESESEVIFEKHVAVKYDRVWSSQIGESFLDVQRAVYFQASKGEKLQWQNIFAGFTAVYGSIARAVNEYCAGREFCEIWFSLDEKGNEKPEGIPIALAECVMEIFMLAGWANLHLFQAIALQYNYLKRLQKKG